MRESVEIDEELREALGQYIEELRTKNKLGFNQLASKIGMNVRTLNEIINGKMKRIIPYHLQKIAYGLKIDYKDLYKIIGYLAEEDFLEVEIYKKKYEDLKKKYEELEKEGARTIVNHGNQTIGANSTIEIQGNQEFKGELDLTGLSVDKIEEVKRFIKFLKS